MKETNKHQLEGLLKARSQDLRQGRRPRTRPLVAQVATAPVGSSSDGYDTASARRCADCDGEISARRLRAMPRATRCLGCQRAAEAAEQRS